DLPDGSTCMEHGDGTKLYAPSVEFFEIIIWNVVAATWAIAAARPLIDKYFRGRNQLVMHSELEELKQAVARIEAAQQDPSDLRRRIDALMRSEERREALDLCVGILERHGWPSEEATSDVEATFRKIAENVGRRRMPSARLTFPHSQILE